MNRNDDTSLALRPAEAAERLGISQRKLWTETKAGRVPHIKLGRAILYPVALLETWLMESASGGTSGASGGGSGGGSGGASGGSRKGGRR